METNSDKKIFFVFKSAVLLFVINLGCGILVPILINVINNAVTNNNVQLTLGSESFQSFCAWLVTALLMCWVLWDDAKKNTAYQCYDLFSGVICFAVMFFTYVFPVLFVEDSDGGVHAFLSSYFITCSWLESGKTGVTTAAAFAIILSIVLMSTAYFASHFVYVRKHPDV